MRRRVFRTAVPVDGLVSDDRVRDIKENGSVTHPAFLHSTGRVPGSVRHERPPAGAVTCHRESEIRSQCFVAARREIWQPPKCLEENVLQEIGGVPRRPCPPRKSSARPATQRRQVSGEKVVDGGSHHLAELG